jgi:hypothetical protein
MEETLLLKFLLKLVKISAVVNSDSAVGMSHTQRCGVMSEEHNRNLAQRSGATTVMDSAKLSAVVNHHSQSDMKIALKNGLNLLRQP